MKTVLRALVLMLLLTGLCYAQGKCKVEGSVKDSAGQGISGVSVTVKSPLNTVSGVTDKQGNYSVTVLCTETSKHTVTPTKAGYSFQPASRPWEKYSGGPSFTGQKKGK